MEIMGGHPHSITIYAPWLVEMTFKELFEKLMSDMKNLGDKVDSTFPMIKSLEFAIKVLY